MRSLAALGQVLAPGQDSCPLSSTSVHPPMCRPPQSLVLLLLRAELLLASRADIAIRPGHVLGSLCPSLCSSLTSVRLQRASVSCYPPRHRCSSLHVLCAPSWVLQQECEDGCSEHSHKGERSPWVEWERAVSASALLGCPGFCRSQAWLQSPAYPPSPAVPSFIALPVFRFSV